MKPRIVFMGSPDFAVPILRRLAENDQVVGIVTQPDRPAGRGRILTPPPIKILADELHLPVIQPRKLNQPEVNQQLHDWSPDLIVVAAFGQILRAEVLNLPQFGCINVHASLLPRWRGAAPIQAAILNGDEDTGITIILMDPGIDTGPILSQRAMQINKDDNVTSLSSRLAGLGADLLTETIPPYITGQLNPQPQDDTKATYAPMLKKEHGLLDFTQPAYELERKVRAFNPWPGSFIYWKNQILKIHRAHVAEYNSISSGKMIIYNGLPAVTTTDGILVFDEVQPAGKNIMSGKSFLQGARDWGSNDRTG